MSNIHEAFLKAQQEARNPGFDSVNPYFKSKYASLSAVLENVRPALFNNGFYIKQNINCDGEKVSLSTSAVFAETGEEVGTMFVSYTLPRNSDNQVQEMGKAITYLRRYSLLTLMGIVGEEDDDAQSLTTKKTTPPPSPPPKPSSKPEPAKPKQSDPVPAFASLGVDMEAVGDEIRALAKDRDKAVAVYKQLKELLEELKRVNLDQKFLEVVSKEGRLSPTGSTLQDTLKAYRDSKELFIPWLRNYGANV